ncbi:serine/threonine-protein kinase H1-like [Amphiura filiformis]|uniref:serine/threonine-protein kinase H1-like n=1 Tax=Amphiura filiformis TaxID=82378 RepID=UPI003B214327
MGCAAPGKLAPEEVPMEKHIDWVKTVETVNGNTIGGTQNGHGGGKRNHYQRDEGRAHRKAKYKASFDPRVTAKYDIKALIGTGSFSRVVRVEHRSTRQPYAIKMVEKRREGKQCWEVELNILRRVKHSNIIQLIEVFDGKDRTYMVMELATGGELFDRIVAKGNFNERGRHARITNGAQAVRYLHSLGITHRDIKPENLLYYHPGNDSKIMITDFGLASCRKTGGEVQQDMMMRTICGTPEYIAPEILLRKAYNEAVDLWAIGVVTYILLSGRMPFDDDNRTRLYRKILRAKYSYSGEPWKDISPAAKDFIDKLLVVNVTERMSAMVALKHPWIISNAAQSSLKNLQKSISHNWLKRTSTRSRSTKSAQSRRSNRSKGSSRSLRSDKSRDKRKLQDKELTALAKEMKKEDVTNGNKPIKSQEIR